MYCIPVLSLSRWSLFPCIFTSSLFIGRFLRAFLLSLDRRNMNLPGRRLTSLFSAKFDTKHGPQPFPYASSHFTVREKLHPFLATIPRVRPSRWLIFNSLLREQTARTASFPTQSEHPRVPPLLSLVLLNPPRHSTPAFFPSINRNSLGDPAGVGVVIRTGISLDC